MNKILFSFFCYTYYKISVINYVSLIQLLDIKYDLCDDLIDKKILYTSILDYVICHLI